MAPDDLLGKSFTFYDHSQPGWVICRHVSVVGFDPMRGWKLAGSGVSSEWVPFTYWRRLLDEGVLVPR